MNTFRLPANPIMNNVKHTHVLATSLIRMSYLRQIVSWNCCFDRVKPNFWSGSEVNQDETPFSDARSSIHLVDSLASSLIPSRRVLYKISFFCLTPFIISVCFSSSISSDWTWLKRADVSCSVAWREHSYSASATNVGSRKLKPPNLAGRLNTRSTAINTDHYFMVY